MYFLWSMFQEQFLYIVICRYSSIRSIGRRWRRLAGAYRWRPRQTRILCIPKQNLHSKTIYLVYDLSKIKNVHLRRAHALKIHKKYIFGLKMSS